MNEELRRIVLDNLATFAAMARFDINDRCLEAFFWREYNLL